MDNFSKLIISAIKPYSAILFLNNKYLGIFLLLVTFLNPSVAISGIVAVIFTILFAELIEFNESYLVQGFYIYNSLLVGMGIGFIFTPSLTSIFIIAISSTFTFMLSFMLNRLFSVYQIPILSLPFSIVTMFIYLASLRYSGLLSSLVNNASRFDIELPLIISGFLKSFGTIFFLPSNIAGGLILLLVLYSSRVVFIMALVGYYFGVFMHSYFIGSYTQALYDPYAFNYILVAIALCGIFLLPTIKNFLLALVGVAISVVLTDAISILFNYYSIPVFTLPFNITVIIFIFLLSTTYYKEFNIDIKETPEKSLSNYLSKIFRFGKINIKISLPFSGEWSVYQAFNDEWTHKGEYKYAYDFVKIRDNKTYKNDGLYKEDYYAFGESILSPVNGYIVDTRDDLCDNIIGEVDRVNNWGNYIIIKSDLGFFVEISHLMQHSINLQVGDYIKGGNIIAKCGNSGYSPEPHIHIQTQYLGVLGGITREFCFVEYIQNNYLIFNDVPKKGEKLYALISDKGISSHFLFVLDDEFKYEVIENGEQKSDYIIKVKMAENGEFYFEDEEGNKLYFYNDLKQFYFYDYIGGESHLKWFFILMPRLPFINSVRLKYRDYLPINLLKNTLEIAYIELVSMINKDIYKQMYIYEFDGVSCISSKYGKAVFGSTHKGLTKLKYSNTKLRRI